MGITHDCIQCNVKFIWKVSLLSHIKANHRTEIELQQKQFYVWQYDICTYYTKSDKGIREQSEKPLFADFGDDVDEDI